MNEQTVTKEGKSKEPILFIIYETLMDAIPFGADEKGVCC